MSGHLMYDPATGHLRFGSGGHLLYSDGTGGGGSLSQIRVRWSQFGLLDSRTFPMFNFIWEGIYNDDPGPLLVRCTQNPDWFSEDGAVGVHAGIQVFKGNSGGEWVVCFSSTNAGYNLVWGSGGSGDDPALGSYPNLITSNFDHYPAGWTPPIRSNMVGVSIARAV